MPTDHASTVMLPETTALIRELMALRSQPRNEAIAAIKAIRVREFEAISRQQIEHLNESTGLDVALSLAAVADAIIRELAERAFLKAGAPAAWHEEVGLFAIGGYGRGELNPYSDIDLLVLARDGRQSPWLTAGNAELQASLWDVKFTVGASLRSLAELERILDEDFVTATAVLEQRPLQAGMALRQGIRDLLVRFRKRRSVPFLKFKLEELAKRREQAGVSLFQMESNLKSNPGCLRDVQLLRNMAFMVSGSRNLFNLAELEVITTKDLVDVAAANDHLLRLRSLLHFHHKRKQDVFQLADQLRIAKQLGYEAVSQLRAVEHFMKHHYAQVLHVHQTVELTISRLRATGHLGRWTLLIKTRKTLDSDFTAVQGQVYVSHGGFWSHPDAPARLLRMCRMAQQRGLRLSLELQRTIRTHLDLVTDQVRADKALARVFLEIIGDLGRTRPILEDMHNCGLLGAYLPEFGNLTCHMQFDSYHQFTVDQHTLFAMGNLDAVVNGQLDGLPGMGEILPAVKRKDLLGLGLLLHDMGKYMGRGHVARGAIMVAQVASRLGLDAQEEELVYWLVEKHVSLSDASRMRDFHEPSFLASFSEKMGNREQLDLLYCLTFADARAVGEGVLTGWQEAILKDLHTTVAEQLRNSGGTAAVSRHDRLVRELVGSGVAEARAQEFIQDLPRNYLHQVPPGEVQRHYAVLQQARDSGVGISHEVKDKYLHIAAALPDRHALFADVTATLSGHGFDIIDARTWVSATGMVVYSFRMSSIYPTRLAEPATWDKLRRDLLAVSKGELAAESLLERRRNARIGPKPADSVFDDPAIKVEQRTSETHTIVDIHVKDEVGLLSRLCRAISDFRCEIGYASINTMGDVAVDVFYVNREGRKLSDEDAEALREHIIRSLDLAPTGGK
jgi:[protein-PII] uridylyltransferase